jgi:hypothetical protein
MRTVVTLAGVFCLLACSSDRGPSPAATSGSATVAQCPIDVSAVQQSPTDSGPSECTASDGASEPCPCILPDGGSVDVCGDGGQCIAGPICTPGGCIGGWVCSYSLGGGGLLVSTLCSASCGLLTVNQAVGVSDAVVCTGQCVQQSDAATAPWSCVSPIGVSFGGSSGEP